MSRRKRRSLRSFLLGRKHARTNLFHRGECFFISTEQKLGFHSNVMELIAELIPAK